MWFRWVARIPELLAYMCRFLEPGTVRALRVALLGACACMPVDCLLTNSLLAKECSAVCNPFWGHGFAMLLRKSIWTLVDANRQILAPHVVRCVMNIHLVLWSSGVVPSHSLVQNRVRFTHQADGSIQWWLQGDSNGWVPCEIVNDLPLRMVMQTQRCVGACWEMAELCLGFNITGQDHLQPSQCVEQWSNKASRVAAAYHGHVAMHCTSQLVYAPVTTTHTPWAGYHFISGRIFLT